MANERYERGLDVYASQLQIPRDEVASWFSERVGARFGEEAILSAAGAWVDDELSLRDRSLVVVAALIAQGDAEQQLRVHVRWAIEHASPTVRAVVRRFPVHRPGRTRLATLFYQLDAGLRTVYQYGLQQTHLTTVSGA